MFSPTYFLGIFSLASIQVARAGVIQQLLSKVDPVSHQFKAGKPLGHEYNCGAERKEILEILKYLNTQASKKKPASQEKLLKACNAVRVAVHAKVWEEERKLMKYESTFTAIDENRDEMAQMQVELFRCVLEWDPEPGFKYNEAFTPVFVTAETLRLKKVSTDESTCGWAETEEDNYEREVVLLFAAENTLQGIKESEQTNNYFLIESIALEDGKVVDFSKDLQNILPISRVKFLEPSPAVQEAVSSSKKL